MNLSFWYPITISEELKEVRKMSKDSEIIFEDDSDSWQAQRSLEEQAQREQEEACPPRHGSPEARGSADRYSGRAYAPHYYEGDSYASERVNFTRLSANDCRLYKKGWDEQIDRKDWG